MHCSEGIFHTKLACLRQGLKKKLVEQKPQKDMLEGLITSDTQEDVLELFVCRYSVSLRVHRAFVVNDFFTTKVRRGTKK